MTANKDYYTLIAYPWWVHHQVDLAFAHTFDRLGIGTSTAILCDGSLSSIRASCELISSNNIDPSSESSEAFCKRCKDLKLRVISRFFKKIVTFSELSRFIPKASEDLTPSFKDLDPIIAGRILSPLLTRYRITDIQQLDQVLAPSSVEIITRLYIQGYFYGREIAKAVLAYHHSRKASPLQFFSLYNARFHPYAGFFDELRSNGCDVLVHERGAVSGSFAFTINGLPSDTDSLLKQSSLANTPSSVSRARDSILKDFMLERICKGQANFTDFNSKKFSVADSRIQNYGPSAVFFTSSMDEIRLFNEEYSYETQIKEILRLAIELRSMNIRLVVRLHPNLAAGLGSANAADIFINDIRHLAHIHDYTVVDPCSNVHWSDLALNSLINFAPNTSLYLDLRYFGFPVLSPKPSQFSAAHDKIDHEPHHSLNCLKQLRRPSVLRERSLSVRKSAYTFYLDRSILSSLICVTNVYESNMKNLMTSSVDELSNDNLYKIVQYTSAITTGSMSSSLPHHILNSNL